MASVGDTDELTRIELENVIALQMRTMQILAAWYLRAVERADRMSFEQPDFLEKRDALIDVATKDAYNMIGQEEAKGVNRSEKAERKYNNEHEQQLHDHFNKKRGIDEPPQPPP